MVIGTILLTGASLTASLLVVQVAVLPLVFKYSKSVQRKMVFSNCINYPRNLDYENPSSCNIVGGRNFSIEFQSNVDACPIKLGAWHIIPCSMFREVFVIRDYMAVDTRLHQELKRTQNPVVLYCHGNSNHRASPHRLQMYKVFQELNFHVITFDYRGYGDSTRVRPTERGVVEDALAVYAWLMEALDQKNKPMVLIWGHSLGTAVAANMTAHLAELCRDQGRPPLPCPDALVLEAPFNNLMDEIESHPFSKLVSWLPYYKDTFVKPFTVSSEYAFTTDQYLSCVPQLPILMLHSKGDKIVPFSLAVKLHEKVAETRGPSDAPLVFHAFEKGVGLGHNNLCEAPELKSVVSDFLSQLVSWLPYYKDTFVKPFTVSSEYAFTTDQYLSCVPQLPILMLHSKGDKIVPFSLAVKLHEKVAETRGPSDAPLVFHAFEKGVGLGHNNLCEAPELKSVVSDFLSQVRSRPHVSQLK